MSLAGKKRYSGEEFIDHSLKVASILEKYKVTDPATLSVAVLHHAITEGAATLDDVEKEFGVEISSMLQTLEGLKVIKLVDTPANEFAENLRKMFLALAKDLRIVLIKLADILDNLGTLQYVSEEKQIEIAKETLEIFAPLAERLGIGEMRGEMQDLSFPYVYPREHMETKKLLNTSLKKLNKRLLMIKVDLQGAVKEEKIPFRIESRTKHLYSLFLKLKRPEINFDISKIYDLNAFRVIVETKEQCYQVLGVVHKLWRPLPNYVRDFIATPKPNGYESIHTTVFGPGGEPFEIQIRTEEMHSEAEYGVASHWNYAEYKEKGATDEDINKGFKTDGQRLEWVKNLSMWQEEVVETEEFLRSIKTDFLGMRIFVFTPKGEVKDLPSGATPIDFAYRVHTILG